MDDIFSDTPLSLPPKNLVFIYFTHLPYKLCSKDHRVDISQTQSLNRKIIFKTRYIFSILISWAGKWPYYIIYLISKPYILDFHSN